MLLVRKRALAACATVFFIGSGSLRAAPSEFCSSLLAQGVRDTASTNLTEARFFEIKSNVCNQNYDSLQKANSQAASGGIDVPGYLGVTGADNTAASEYSQRYAAMCKSDFSTASGRWCTLII